MMSFERGQWGETVEHLGSQVCEGLIPPDGGLGTLPQKSHLTAGPLKKLFCFLGSLLLDSSEMKPAFLSSMIVGFLCP